MKFNEIVTVIVEHTGQYRDNYLAEMTDEKKKDLIKALFELRVSIRWYQLTSNEQIKQLWDKVRANVELTDYVIRGTSAMIMRFHDSQQQWSNLIGQMAEAICWVTSDTKIGKEVTERAPQMESFKASINSSPWLFFLYMETLTPQVKP